jgi:hypothetical protein
VWRPWPQEKAFRRPRNGIPHRHSREACPRESGERQSTGSRVVMVGDGVITRVRGRTILGSPVCGEDSLYAPVTTRANIAASA